MAIVKPSSARRQAPRKGPPRRLGSCDGTVRRTIAMIALVLGVILGTSEPEYLIALLPIEALIAFELIFWNDCSEQRRNERSERSKGPE
jgi:hypothetical protein